MNKKQTIKKTAALLLGLTLAMGATGCGFITTDSLKDLDQVVAKVDIASMMDNETVKPEFAKMKLSGEVKKRELISYYISIGYQYVQQYGYSYEDAFNLLLNALINKETLAQEAVAYFLADSTYGLSGAGFEAYQTAETEKLATKEQKALLGKDGKYEEIFALKYVLTEGGKEEAMVDYNVAEYTLKKNLNNSIDSIETSLVEAEEEEHNHGETRTLPTNVDKEVEDYYVEGYEVYTGRDLKANYPGYEKVEGSTIATRQKAYNAFLTNLQKYNLVNPSGYVENTSKVENLEYYYVELASLLEQRLINKYYQALEGEITKKLTDEYVSEKYEEMFNADKKKYKDSPNAFGTALDGVKADNFVLYAPECFNAETQEVMTFGYVYNILLPFSTSQSVAYTEAKNMGLTQNDLYVARREIGAQVKGKDLRTSWIAEHDHADYSYKGEDGQYYFFEENMKGETHEKLTQYAGQYPFNGTVNETKSEVKANSVTIDEFMEIFEAQIDKAVGKDVTKNGAKVNDYNTNEYKDAEGEIDYSKFIYYTGSVELENQTAKGFFDPTTDQYKALSAVNELMFAYSTDNGCLNTYMGYSVSPYGTNFVKEFEKAAQDVVAQGVGSYAVCLTDYGWHIVYCSFSYKEGYIGANNSVYGGYVDAEKDVEGTFSNLFYNYIKDKAYTNYSNEQQNKILKKYEKCATRYEAKYKDLYNFNM